MRTVDRRGRFRACLALGFLLTSVAIALPAGAEGGRYLIICPDNLLPAIEPLAEWKSRKGMQAYVAPLSETGYIAYEIRQYIVEAVEDWDPAPEYVLLVGSSGMIPFADSYGDTGYGCIDDDMFMDIHPGRFPASTALDVEVMVEKTLNYERWPTTDPTYYNSAGLTIARDYDDDDWVHYFGDANWEAGLMTAAGFDNVELISSDTTPDPAGVWEDLLDAGMAYGGFHGQVGGWSTYNACADYAAAGTMQPVLAVYTCSGGSYGDSWLLAGSPGDPRGAVGYVGQRTSCSGCAHWRSALRRGFWGYIFEDTGDSDVATFGAAAEAGRLNYVEVIHDTSEYQSSIVWGDPELNLWTREPRTIAVSHPPTIPCAEDVEFSTMVSLDAQPHENAVVGLMSAEGTFAHATTDETGAARFSLDTRSDSLLYVTVTGRDLRPYEGEIVVGTGEPVGDDDAADDDTADDDIADDDDTADDDEAIETDPISTVEVGTGDCECTQSSGNAHGFIALAPALALWLTRRRGRPRRGTRDLASAR